MGLFRAMALGETIMPPALRGDLLVSGPALACFVALGAVWGAIAALLPDLRAAIGAGDALLGVILFTTAAVSAGAMLAAPAVGRIVGRVALPLATAAMVASLLLPGQTALAWQFALAMALVGGTSGLVEVLMNARVAALEAATGRPLMNLNHAGYSLSFFAVAVGTGLAREAGLTPAVIFSVLAAGCVPLVLLAVRRPPGVAEPAAPGADEGARGASGFAVAPLVLLGGGVILLASLAEAGTETWSALHLERSIGTSPALGALGPAILGLTMGLGRLAGQALSRRVPEARLMQAGGTLAALGAVLGAVAPGPITAFAGIALVGAGASVIVPIALAVVGRGAAGAERARRIAHASVIGFVGYVGGPALMGMISALADLRTAFLILGLVLLLLPLLAPRLTRSAVR